MLIIIRVVTLNLVSKLVHSLAGPLSVTDRTAFARYP